MEHKTLVHDMTLMLIYLTSWREKKEWSPRAWKGYDFGVLNSLEEEDFIYGSHKAKTVHLTEEGEETAKLLLEKYFGSFEFE